MTDRSAAWLVLGFAGQAVFTARFLVQWLASERCRNSVVPVAFWWLSLVGGSFLLIYACSRRILSSSSARAWACSSMCAT